jgi:hypothetical protein
VAKLLLLKEKKLNDICEFCGNANGCYERKDEHGAWRSSCYDCARPKPAAKRPAKEDFTFLDDPLDPVAPVNDQKAKFQSTLFS